MSNYAEKLMPKVRELYALAIETHNIHLNYKGDCFLEVHRLLGDQYLHLIEQADSLAERVRAEGESALLTPANVAGEACGVTDLASLADEHGEEAEDFGKLSEEYAADCPALANLLADFQAWHQKQRWFLAATLGEEA